MNKIYKIKTDHWYIERITFLLAGIFVFVSSALAYFININWIFFTLFVSIMLITFALTGYCPMSILLKKVGKEGRCGR